MATAIWPLEMAKKTQQKAPRSLHLFAYFACFRRSLHFSLAFAIFGLSVSALFWAFVLALFRKIRLLPFSGCHLDSTDELSYNGIKN